MYRTRMFVNIVYIHLLAICQWRCVCDGTYRTGKNTYSELYFIKYGEKSTEHCVGMWYERVNVLIFIL